MNPNFEKDPNGLLPAIVQNDVNGQVLMLGYMNEEAYEKTLSERKVTFFSRSKKRLWTKGETSGNFLNVVSVQIDCDQDAILVKVKPDGPTCHTGSESCFGNSSVGFLYELEEIVRQRLGSGDEKSYTAELAKKGVAKVAQKVGEEAVEVVIEAMAGNDALLKEETADLVFHLLVLLQMKGISLSDVEEILARRNR